MLWNGECLITCPQGFYSDSESLNCHACPPECKVCSSPLECTECLPSYYKHNNMCLNPCPSETYPNDVLKECVGCDAACDGCFGPTNHQCLDCKYEAGYIKTDSQSNTCYQQECGEGTYFQDGQCLPCDDSCATCKGEGIYNCTACVEELTFIIQPDSELICSNCIEGFKANNKGKCEGSCFVI